MKAEIGVTQPQAKKMPKTDNKQPPEAKGEAENGFSLTAPERNKPYLHLYFRHLDIKRNLG